MGGQSWLAQRGARAGPRPPIAAPIYTGDPMIGTTGDDFMFGHASASAIDNTITADAGDDFVLGDIGGFYAVSPAGGGDNNGSLGTAIDIDLSISWSTDENPLFGDASIPHVTAYVEATSAQEEWYSLTLGAGATITIDIDYGGSPTIGVFTNTVVDLVDGGGNVLASNDNGSGAGDGAGTTYSNDSYLAHTVAAAGAYFIRIYEFGTITFGGGENFLLNVSASGHATGAATTMGDDTIAGDDGDDELFGVGGADSIDGGAGADRIDGGSGGDTIAGGADSDTLSGGDGDDLFAMGAEEAGVLDEVAGGDGDDTMSFAGAASAMSVVFGFGNDGEGAASDGAFEFDDVETVVGSGFDDIFSSEVDGFAFEGGDGADTLDESLLTGGGSFYWDLEIGYLGIVSFAGPVNGTLAGFENYIGFSGEDFVRGGGADNLLRGEAGDDGLEGEEGADTLAGGAGADALDGGAGIDWADYSSAALKVVADLLTGASNLNDAAGDSYVDVENLRGTAFNDLLQGDHGDNLIDGGIKNDNLRGRKGADTLIGGVGQDTLNGAPDADQFRFDDIAVGGHDRILDFTSGDDEIALLGAAFGLTPGALGGNRFVVADQAQDASDRVIYDAATGKLWFDPDGTGAAAQTKIAVLSGLPTLAANDFTVI